MLPKAICTLLLAVLCKLLVYSQQQNLVPNSSFEQTIVDDFSYFSSSWKKCLKSDTPDYFSLPDDPSAQNQNTKYIGGAFPASGNSYIGLYFYRSNPDYNVKNVREFIQIKLSDKLIKDSVYSIDFKLFLDAESNVALKKFGVLLSDELIVEKREQTVFKRSPQVIFANDEYYDDSKKWMNVSSEYKAKGWEEYIVLGNFWPDEKTRKKTIKGDIDPNKLNKWNKFPNEKIAYYYIDDVTIKLCSNKKQEKYISTIEKIPTKETSNFFIDINEIKTDSIIVLKNILFQFDESILLEESFEELGKLYSFLDDNPSISIDIYGHTDSKGSDLYNEKLSTNRAKAVYRYLIDKGIESKRMSFEGFGKTKPIASNEFEEGRRLNRRVEIKIKKNRL